MISHPSKSIERRFLISIALTCFILVVEVAGGWWTGSLALLSDAAHVFLDIFALGLSYFALRLSALPADRDYTFGYHRFEVFASLINGITLALVSVGIFWEAYHRFYSPQPVKSVELLAIALLGLAVNLIVAFILGGHHHDEHGDEQHNDHHSDHEGSDHEKRHEEHHHGVKDANVQSAMYHVLGDAVSSLGVIAAAVIIWKTGWTIADPLAGALIGITIVAGSWRVIKSSAHIMMEGTPACFKLEDVEENMRRSPGVAEVHDLHVWNLCSHHALLSAHVVTDSKSGVPSQEIMMNLKTRLKNEFGIEHSTLQMEPECCENDAVCIGCKSNHRPVN
jgi:cobalt-zinc-cadmium efflux system protein